MPPCLYRKNPCRPAPRQPRQWGCLRLRAPRSTTRETQKTVTLKNKLLGKLDPETGEIVPTRLKASLEGLPASIEHACLADILDLVARREQDRQRGLERLQDGRGSEDRHHRPLQSPRTARRSPHGGLAGRPPDALRGRPGRSACELFDKVTRMATGSKFFASRAARLETSPSVAFDSTTVSTTTARGRPRPAGFARTATGWTPSSCSRSTR